MIKDMTLDMYCELLASDEPTIGGGTAAAITGAMAASLVMMVANLSIGKKKYLEHEPVFQDVLGKMRDIQQLLLDKADEDKASFEAVMQAFRLPKSNPDEILDRNAAIEDATKTATLVPLSVAMWAIEVVKSAILVIEYGNINARSDGLVGAQLASTCFISAIYNVRTNLITISDQDFVSEINEKVTTAISQMNVFESMWKKFTG
ncbi:MAG: methenyltetrahydrofolate cyclohydrolase [Firmicutes bacterium HGW-Firmicutes-20]|jgi:formiminotetrahydrofolate cyclodeaminase|nr:MAG: methenyltetrahydrofolate cyclohydrolase [Firmicutes bacterium HGW-Firmicutes-20]PKM90525.1 MAG: methenyltetrahydrofolate cyclohydrolase [Firmicutes bacterium HGW-Firmicutes-10]